MSEPTVQMTPMQMDEELQRQIETGQIKVDLHNHYHQFPSVPDGVPTPAQIDNAEDGELVE
jgi:hypothetical protein